MRNADKMVIFLKNAILDQKFAFFHLKRIFNEVGGRKRSRCYQGVLTDMHCEQLHAIDNTINKMAC